MNNREWRLIELYPDFSNRDLYKKLEILKIQEFSPVMEKFVNAKINEEEAKELELMAFVHKSKTIPTTSL